MWSLNTLKGFLMKSFLPSSGHLEVLAGNKVGHDLKGERNVSIEQRGMVLMVKKSFTLQRNTFQNCFREKKTEYDFKEI